MTLPLKIIYISIVVSISHPQPSSDDSLTKQVKVTVTSKRVVQVWFVGCENRRLYIEILRGRKSLCFSYQKHQVIPAYSCETWPQRNTGHAGHIFHDN